MKYFKIASAVMALLLLLTVFVSCKDDSETPPVTPPATEQRFDYFAVEDYSEYVSLDKSVYENMKIELDTDYTVTDKQVDEYIDYLLFSKKTKTDGDTKITKEAIKRGDTAYIFYKGMLYNPETEKDEEFEGGSNMTDASPYALSIGSDSFIPGFEEALIGIVPSETGPEDMVSIDLTFPEDYRETTLAGKEVTFYVYVAWIVQYDIPEYNEAFVKETLKFEAKTDDVIAEHRASIRESLEASFESAKNQAVESKIWEILYEKATIISYPASEVAYFYNYYYGVIEDEMTRYSYYGYTFSSLDEFGVWYFGLEEGGDWEAILEDQAKQAVAQTLIYHAVAQACEIVVSDEQFNSMVQQYVDYYKSSGKEYTAEQVIAEVGEAAIREGVLYKNVVGYIEENATVTAKANTEE